MPLTQGLQLPFGIQPVNPLPVDAWSGPYTGITEALSSIPLAIRFPTMEVRILDSISGNTIYWFKDGVQDSDLILFTPNLNEIKQEILDLQSEKFDKTGGTIDGYVVASGFTGSGEGLFDIPASGITGLNLDRIQSDGNTAIMSSSGLTVNSNINVEGDIFISGKTAATQNYVVNTSEISIVTGSTTPPLITNYKNGDEWTDNDTMIKYTMYDDGDTKQWVQF